MKKTPIVCGHCNTINYRVAELTCRQCGEYFPTKVEPAVVKKIKSDVFVVAGVGTVLGAIAGTAAALFTFVIASVM